MYINYKKRAIMSAFIFMGITTVKAQMPDRVGLKVGYGSSVANFNYQGTNSFSGGQDAWVAPDISLMVEWDIEQWLSISAEPGLVHRGYKRELNFILIPSGPTSPSQAKLRYFSLPVLARVKPFPWRLSPYLELGPRLDLLLSKKINNADSYVRQVFEEYNTVTGGASAGVGVELGQLFPSVNISLSGRYNWDTFNSYSDEFFTIKKRSAELWLGITYSF
jgi:hypothetical protein